MQNKLTIGEPVDGAPARWPEPITLSGRFGRVEKMVAKKHGASLWDAFKDHDNVWFYMRTGPFADKDSLFAFLADKEGQSDPCMYAILDLQNCAIGLSALMTIRPDMRVIEVGNVSYAPALQRTPLGTEAQYLLMKYAFEDLGYRRYEWKCNALNEKSRRAALRYGFTYEGTFRQQEIIKGRNRDTAWYSIIDKEWPEIKKSFERWLAPDNFDENGRQNTSLASGKG